MEIEAVIQIGILGWVERGIESQSDNYMVECVCVCVQNLLVLYE